MKKKFIFLLLYSIPLLFFASSLCAQNPVYIDKSGIMRWTKDKKEACFFGVNYTVPFAYGYRSHKALGKDLKQAIDEDVHHFERLAIDAFRVHMWDVEITDSLGNLLKNDHLDLFDYLLYKLSERAIYSLITPIAFWGNGYPERDEKTPGFATVYGKGPSVVKEEAIRAQENYLSQLMDHVNPYTKKKYKDDPYIIALEINNEPHHSGPKEKTTEYVNRLAGAVRNKGWTKPVFYNISESPTYSDAVAKSKVEGHSFQWYPSGLVAGQERKGNFLPHVDRYAIPFDSVAEYKNKTLMVYEFDAADIMQPIMYPAMARSYRTAGFQWATQFAYDPLATAYGNTEYQTHYLNLYYTPAKAISLMIASEVFHRVPRLKSYGAFPTDTLFDVFRVSYKNQLSEMNSGDKFYYTGTTSTKPRDIESLQRIAGTGSSSLVSYEGTGAYFLDKINDGIWRLEVMPDAITIRDPFEKASPKKEVVRLEYRKNKMVLHGLKTGFSVFPLGGSVDTINTVYSYDMLDDSSMMISPGIYILYGPGNNIDNMRFAMNQFIAPKPFSNEVAVYHVPPAEVSQGKGIKLSANVAGFQKDDKISIELRAVPRWRTIEMKKVSAGKYVAEIPDSVVTPGVMSYRFLVQKANGEHIVFPGNTKGNPYAWDNTANDTYELLVAAPGNSLEIFNTNRDRRSIVQYNQDWRNNFIRIVPADKTTQLAVKVWSRKLVDGLVMGWQHYFGSIVKGRAGELSSFKSMVIKARSDNGGKASIGLINKDGFTFSVAVELSSEWKEIRILFNNLKGDSMLLLPRPYPGFHPLWFKAEGKSVFNFEEMEKLQVVCYGEGKEVNVEVAYVVLEK